MKINVECVGDMMFEAKVGKHKIRYDVPKDFGGKDRALTAPMQFAASITACSTAIAAIFCKKSGISIEGLNSELDFEINEDHSLKDFKIVLTVPHSPSEKLDAIKRAASLCPLHQTLDNYDGMDIDVKI